MFCHMLLPASDLHNTTDRITFNKNELILKGFDHYKMHTRKGTVSVPKGQAEKVHNSGAMDG